MVKLHLGAGKRYFRDYINIDLNGEGLDRRMDIRTLDYPDGSVDEIMLIHVWEHFWADEADAILKEYFRALKPGGKLIMEMPDIKKVLHFFTRPDAPVALTYRALYGGYINGEEAKCIESLHKWAWTYDTLAPLAEKVGFKCAEGVPQYHMVHRDFRIECTKEVPVAQ